jgi:alpha-1,6-mannosyltransferase
MKIVDLALYSPETTSGVRTYIENKIRYVNARSNGIEHVVLVPAREARVEVEGRSKIIYLRGVPTFYPKLRLAANVWKAAKIIQEEAPDVIEVNCQFALPWAAFLATRNRKVPVVGVYHTDVPECAGVLVQKWGRPVSSVFRSLARFYEGLIYRHFTRTVIFNAEMAGALNRLGVHRIDCIPCGVDLATFHPDKRDPRFRENLGIPPQAKILLYVGRLSPEKEVQTLLKAYACLPEGQYVLLIVGDGPEEAAMRSYAESHPGVRFLGHMDRPSELAAVYASSDVYVMPGRYETFGMSTVEALACGLPVVGIEESGTGTIVTPGVGALARAGDPQDLAAKISAVASWTDDKVRAACRSRASTSYSWNEIFDRYFSLYRRLISDGGRFQAQAS